MIHVKVGLSAGDFVGDSNETIQLAIEAAAARGGGTVEVAPGVYTLYHSVVLRRNVRLVGSGPDTVLRKGQGPASEFAVDADYGQTKVTVKDPTGFRAGMGVVVKDGRSGGWLDTLAAVTLVQGKVLHLDRMLIMDYDADNGGLIVNSFPLIAGFDLDGVVIEGLCVDGNKAESLPINGCIGGGCYLFKARNCRLSDCLVRDFAGDGISFQITQDVTVERCEVTRASGLGLHPGTGSARPVIRDRKSHHNDGDGLFLCWRVQDGYFEGNQLCDNGRHGISIGHKDTDNVFVNNIVRNNGSHGVYFRDEKPTNAGSRNTFRGNVIEDNVGSGVCVEGHTTDLFFEDNTIRDTRPATARRQRTGIFAGEHAARLRAVRNHMENHAEGHFQGEIAVEA